MATRRILLYSHDTFGLGHLRRTLKLADALLADGETTCLVVTGSACHHLLQPRPGLDFVKLPAVIKTGPECYPPRSLGISARHILELRSRLLQSAAEAFAPHVLVVDNVPRGMLGELEPTLAAVERGAIDARVVLTTRDILDESAVICRLWSQHGVYSLLERVYDEILVLGASAVFDLASEYRFPPSLVARTTYCGYVGSVASPPRPEADHRLLFTVGGGGDGGDLARCFLAALEGVPEELRAPTLMALGPDMPEAERARIAALAPEVSGLEVDDYVPGFEGHIAGSFTVLSMGGYNTLCEVVSLGKRALIVPRRQPRREQLLRGQRFAELGLVHLHDREPVTPASLGAHLRRVLLGPPPAPVDGRLSFDGVACAAAHIQCLAGKPALEPSTPSHV